MLVTGEPEGKHMTKKTKWVDEFEGLTSIDDLELADDIFSLDELAELQKKKKITIELKNTDVEFFKEEAKKRSVSYQAMIRDLLSKCAQQMRINTSNKY